MEEGREVRRVGEAKVVAIHHKRHPLVIVYLSKNLILCCGSFVYSASSLVGKIFGFHNNSRFHSHGKP